MDPAIPVQTDERGFTLLEVLIAMAILVVGLISMAYGIGIGLAAVQMSTMDTIAREKAREAMEDVFTARDTSAIAFTQICNIPTSGGNPSNCLFVNGLQPMYTSDSSGLVNTNASATQGTLETYVTPGPDGILGTADDVPYNLTGFQRSIQVTALSSSDGYTNLAQVTVTIQYNPLPWLSRTVTMITVMSPYV
ncbi:MAG: prepilin-type N-terminal cleavage/methylation domain-containing protein [Terriglobia bacterium]|jgi:prepilin-type N-terminal cleavage/methylation domain-containing protein